MRTKTYTDQGNQRWLFKARKSMFTCGANQEQDLFIQVQRKSGQFETVMLLGARGLFRCFGDVQRTIVEEAVAFRDQAQVL